MKKLVLLFLVLFIGCAEVVKVEEHIGVVTMDICCGQLIVKNLLDDYTKHKVRDEDEVYTTGDTIIYYEHHYDDKMANVDYSTHKKEIGDL